MPPTDSSTVRAARSRTLPASRDQAFDTDLFETYVARVVRRHLLSVYVEPEHKVLRDEIRLIGEAGMKLRAHLAETVPKWGLGWRLCKTVIIKHIRELAESRLACHDVEDDVKDEVLEAIYREDFESLWPDGWLDG